MLKLEELIIDGQKTVLEAMQSLDRTGQRIMFLAPDGKLQAALTDGDLRKHLLQGGSLEDPVTLAANHRPKSLPIQERAKARQVLTEHQIDALPLVDRDGRIVDIVFSNGLDLIHSKDLGVPVVINAGGLGTRLQPYTNVLPKPLIPIGEKPIVELIMDRFADAGFRDFHMIVNYKKKMIESYFSEMENEPYHLRFVEEKTFLGTGGGLSLLKGSLSRPFFFSNCDTLLDVDFEDIYRYHCDGGHLITMICANKCMSIPYGVIHLNEEGTIASMQEKPQFSFLTNTGVYVVNPEVVEALEDNKSLSFPDIINQYREKGSSIGVYAIPEESWIDIGQLEELERIRQKFNQ